MLVAALLAIELLFQSFNFPPSKYSFQYRELWEGETVNFQTNPKGILNYYSGNYHRGSDDSTRYSFRIDNAGHLMVSKLRACIGKHQSQLTLDHADGSITRNGDTLNIKAQTVFTKFYIFGIQENGIVDSLSAEISVNLVSKTLNGKSCRNLVRVDSHVDVCALPEKVKIKEIYKDHHADYTIGEFVYFSVTDSKNKTRNFPHGDYVIIGANSKTLVTQ